MKSWNPLGMLVLFVLICFAVAGSGAIFTNSSVSSWYPAIRKPSWNPPAWVFGPVWSALYLVMAIAAWLVWRRRGFDGAKGALGLFAFQLALNAAWSPLFFGLKNSLAAWLMSIAPVWAHSPLFPPSNNSLQTACAIRGPTPDSRGIVRNDFLQV